MDSLHTIAQELAADWDLTLGEELPGATCSLILSGLDFNGREVVLKVPESHAEEKDAWPVVHSFSSHGGVTLLHVDEKSGSILMPRLRPGSTLADTKLTDMERVEVCASLILKLREAQKIETMSMERWMQEIFIESQDLLVKEAQEITKFLLETTTDQVLLHGDLHHYNILADGSGWCVIDPKGIMGDPAFEIVGYMRNPWFGPHLPEAMEKRLKRFSEILSDDPYRLWAWSFVQTLLCSLQSDGRPFDPAPMRQAAEAIYAVRPR